MPSRQTRRNGMARIGIRVAKVIAPAKKRCVSPAASRLPSHCAATTDSGSSALSAASSQASCQRCNAPSSCNRMKASASSSAAKKSASNCRRRRHQVPTVAAARSVRQHPCRRSISCSSGPSTAASMPPISS
ncbi:MAG: hypothetical protein AW07_04778 [Candidatus Accumulibacter sp. SK-11]|nr:MAG: hypothetical protein AW07_04778 [Candidatus Accumulibacter sp. SK-11]